MTTLEPEFDQSERDTWYMLDAYTATLCPQCGLPKEICSSAGGLDGDGYYIAQHMCFATAVMQATQRKISKRHASEEPGEDGFLMTDGVMLRVALTDPDTEDVLGLE